MWLLCHEVTSCQSGSFGVTLRADPQACWRSTIYEAKSDLQWVEICPEMGCKQDGSCWSDDACDFHAVRFNVMRAAKCSYNPADKKENVSSGQLVI